MKQSILRVMSVRSQAGISITPTEFAESTRTAEDAVAAIDTAVGQIVTSLVFMDDQQPILLLVSGPSRVDVAAVSKRLDMTHKRAPVKQTIYERKDQEELMVLVEMMHPLEFLAVISLCNL